MTAKFVTITEGQLAEAACGPLINLRDWLAVREAGVRDKQERAYLNHDTLREAEYMGERRGLHLALFYVAEALRTAKPDTEETQP